MIVAIKMTSGICVPSAAIPWMMPRTSTSPIPLTSASTQKLLLSKLTKATSATELPLSTFQASFRILATLTTPATSQKYSDFLLNLGGFRDRKDLEQVMRGAGARNAVQSRGMVREVFICQKGKGIVRLSAPAHSFTLFLIMKLPLA